MNPLLKITDLPDHYLVIDDDGTARLVTPGNDSLADLQTLVDGWVECVRLPGGVDCWVNEEGLLRNPMDFSYNYLGTHIVREWTGQPYDLVGPCVFTSNDGEGATKPLAPGFTIDTVNKGVHLTPRYQSEQSLLLFHTVQECADLMTASRREFMEAQA
jgi:hypothetical protein